MKTNGQPKLSRKVIDIADFILKHPEMKISDVISVFCGKFRKTSRTIESYISQAKKYNSNRLQKREKAKDDVLTNDAKEAIKRDIATYEETLEIVTRILRGKARKIGDEVLIPTDGDILRAADRLSKMKGWELEKVDLTTNGRSLNQQTEIIFKHFDGRYNKGRK